MLDINTMQKNWTFGDYINYYAQQCNGNYLELINLSTKYKISLKNMSAICMKKTDGGGLTQIIKGGKFKFDYSEKGLKQIDDKVKSINKMLNALKLPLQSKLLSALTLAYENNNFIVDKFIEKVNNQRDRVYKCTTVKGYLRMIEDLYNYRISHKVFLFENRR